MDKAENPKFPGNPGLMCDGRLFTDYRHRDEQNQEINNQALGHHHNDHLYRQYLTANGQNLMDRNLQKAEMHAKCRNINSQNFLEEVHSDVSSLLDYVARPKNLM